MSSMYDRFENNTYEIKTTAFTAKGASFGFITRPLMHAPFVNQGKWGTVTLHLTSCKGSANVMPGDSYMQLVPVHHGEEIAYAVETTPTELFLHTAYGDIRACFAEPSLILMQGENDLGIRLETMLPGHGVLRQRGENAWERSVSTVSCFTFNAVKGTIDMNAKWEMERLSTPYVRGEVHPDQDGTFLLSVEETMDCGYIRDSYPSYAEGLAAVKKDWEDFYEKLPGKEDKNKEKAAYMLWSMLERPSGRLTRSILHSSFHRIAPVWKADLMTAALAGNLPVAADILLGQIDQQAKDGQIPSFFDHLNYDALNAGPPLQGWALKALMKKNDLKAALPKEDLQTLYDGFARWAAWFDTYRDDDKDGIVQTEGMVEAGAEDSPVFAKYYVVELPDINAELALLEEAAGDLAGMLDLPEEKEKWYAKSKERIEKIVEKFWNGKRFVGFDHETGGEIGTASLTFYRPLMLGDRLPKDVTDKMAEDLGFGNGFLTPAGFISQWMGCRDFTRLSVEAGSVLAWENILVATGLSDAGKKDLAKEAAQRYCDALLHPASTYYNASAGFDSADTAAAYFILQELAEN